MKLLYEFIAGIRGAEGGTAEIYRRGTSARATLYQDLEAKLATLTSPVELDAFGRCPPLYVNEMCTIHVFTEAGAELICYEVGDQATAIEVISSRFTGEDYATAESAVAKPVLLITVLELLQDAINSLTVDVAAVAGLGIVYNVKDPKYGAEGDGITDDYAACMAAIADATADGGGIVFFPAGTYYLSDPLVIGGTVSFWGAGSNNTQLLIAASASAPAVTANTTVTQTGLHISIQGLQFEADDTVAQPALRIAADAATYAVRTTVRQCVFNRSRYFNCGVVVTGGPPALATIDDCEFSVGTCKGVYTPLTVVPPEDVTAPTVIVSRCRFRQVGTTKSVDDVIICRGIVTGSLFDNGAAVQPSFVANVHVPTTADGPVLVTGCVFTNPAAASDYTFAVWSESEVTIESGNSIGEDLTVIIAYGGESTIRQTRVGSRGYRTRDEQGNSSASLSPQDWHTEDLLIDQDITLLIAGAPLGTRFAVVIENMSQAQRTVAWTGDFSGDRTVDQGHVGLLLFIQTQVNGNNNWACYSSTYSWARPV